jgi:hypothetical protein
MKMTHTPLSKSSEPTPQKKGERLLYKDSIPLQSICLFLVFLLFSCSVTVLSADDDIATIGDISEYIDELENDTAGETTDEQPFLIIPIDTSDTAVDTQIVGGFHLPKNPTKAAFLSAFIPGAGQFYNERYLKGAFVIGTQATLVGMTVYYDQKMKEYRSKTRNNTEMGGDYFHDRMMYYDYYDSRQSFIFWVGATIFLSAIDAFVDAHLMNFKEMKNEIHLKFEDEKLILSVRF